MTVHDLPAVNASLNAVSGTLLLAGYVLIKKGRVAQHRLCMIAAFVASSLFLVCYVVYHAQVGSRPYAGGGWLRTLYFAILVTHTVLAIAILPLVSTTLYRALRTQFARHARLARVTFPIWLYVSVTGVVVYWMLYHG